MLSVEIFFHCPSCKFSEGKSGKIADDDSDDHVSEVVLPDEYSADGHHCPKRKAGYGWLLPGSVGTMGITAIFTKAVPETGLLFSIIWGA